jgi:RNA polymerase sigma factor (sigma-70 family)
MKTLDQYYKEARTLIKHYGFRHLLNDENNVGDVVTSLIQAEKDFNGNGSLNGFRAYKAKFKMQDLSKNNKHNHEVLYNDISYSSNNSRLEVIDILDQLTPRLGDILYRYFYQNKTLDEIGKDLNISKQRVQQLLNRAKDDFKEIYEQN